MRRKGLWRLRSRNRAVDRTCRACRCQAAQAASCKIRSTVPGQRRGDKYGQSWLSAFRLTLTAPIRALLNPHRCFDSSPIFFELFLIDGFNSTEDNVCGHDRSPSLLIDCRNSHGNPWAVARVAYMLPPFAWM